MVDQTPKHQRFLRRGRVARLTLGVPLAAAAAGIAYSACAVPHRLPLPAALTGARHMLSGRAGPVSYYVAGDGPPLLLLHSINAAASAYEMRPIFEGALPNRRVYAPDLPGFGFSGRARRSYDVPLFVSAIEDVVDLMVRETGVPAIDAVALSLTGEFLARAAVARPKHFRTLTLVSPTGFRTKDRRRTGPTGSTREVAGLEFVVSTPPWSQALFDLLCSRASIRFFLRKTFGSRDVDPGLLAYDYLTSHQPGARHAVFAFLSGRLFSSDIRAVYDALELPVWVPHGCRGDFTDFSSAQAFRRRPNWSFQAYQTGALPHFERGDEFLTALEGFLAGGPPRDSAPSADKLRRASA